MPDRPPLGGLHHLSLTVSDLDRSVPWYREVLGFSLVGEFGHDGGRTVVVTQAGTGLVLLLQEHKAHEGSTFSEFRPGLDHLSFRVPDRSALESWRTWLTDAGVEVPRVLEEEFGTVLVFRDPDRIQLELFVDPAAAEPQG